MSSIASKDFMINAIVANMINMFGEVIKNAPSKDANITTIDGSVWSYSATDMLLFNGVFSDKNVVANPQKHFADVIKFFSTKPYPYAWWWMDQSPIPDAIQNELTQHHFNPLGVFWGVAAPLENFVMTKQAETAAIKEVTTESEYRDFVEIVGTVFHFSEEGKKNFTPMFSSYGPNGTFKHYIGYKDGKAVATVTGYISDDVAGIYNAATLPDAQKTGLCSALMQRVMQEGKNRGCSVSVAQLMAPGMAKSLMEKIGFSTYCEMYPFMAGNE